VLKPRDVFWMTIQAQLQGREDIVIFRAQLSTPPLLDLELADPKSWSGRNALRQVAERKWEGRTTHDGLQLMAPKGLLDLAAKTTEGLAAPMQSLAPRFARFSLRRDAPNLELHVPFPRFRTDSAERYFDALRALARAVSERE
jgi:hypothetical protein